MSTVTIRTASPADAAMLARSHALCFDPAWDEAAFSRFLRDPHIIGLHADSLAFILIRVAADECEILTLGTVPSTRRSGLARALVNTGALEAHRRGARRMFLEVASDNEAAQALYAGAGFAAVGRRPGYYISAAGHAADAVILSAALPLSPGVLS